MYIAELTPISARRNTKVVEALNIDQELLNTGMEIFSKVVRTRW